MPIQHRHSRESGNLLSVSARQHQPSAPSPAQAGIHDFPATTRPHKSNRTDAVPSNTVIARSAATKQSIFPIKQPAGAPYPAAATSLPPANR
jgi:hypothetical protein